MNVKRIIPEIVSTNVEATRAFYCDLLGLQVDMEEGAFLMMSSTTEPSAQLIVNDNGHAGLPPGFAIDIEDPDKVQSLYTEFIRRGFPIVELLADKTWGIRRFSVIDPNGVRVTVISHM